MINILMQLLVVCGLIPLATPHASGPPPTDHVCKEMFPMGHHVDSQMSESPYEIDLNMNVYQPWENLTVSIRAKRPDTYINFKGFFIQARRANCYHHKQKEAVGHFYIRQYENHLMQTLKCNNRLHSALSHRTNNGLIKAVFTWVAPGALIGDLYLVATVVQSQKVFWTGVTSNIIREVNKKDDALGTICPSRKHLIPKETYSTTTQIPPVTDQSRSSAVTCIQTRLLGVLCAIVLVTFSYV